MIKNKYGAWKETQFEGFCERLHARIHWLLIYAENHDPALPSYFVVTLKRLNALNRLMNYDPTIIEIMNTVEMAKTEYEKQSFTPEYKNLVFEAHELVDRIVENRWPNEP